MFHLWDAADSLNSARDDGVEIKVSSSDTYTVHPRVCLAQQDQVGLEDIFCYKCHNSYFGCSYCYGIASRIDNKMVYADSNYYENEDTMPGLRDQTVEMNVITILKYVHCLFYFNDDIFPTLYIFILFLSCASFFFLFVDNTEKFDN